MKPIYLQVKLEKLAYRAKVHLFQYFNLKGETNILYRLITCKVRYFKPLFDIISIDYCVQLMKTPNSKSQKILILHEINEKKGF